MIRYHLPDVEDLIRLGEPRPNAVSIYLPTAPTPSGREQAFTTAKSSVDEAIRSLRSAGATVGVQDAVRAQWEALASDTQLWGNLSGSLAIFISPDFSEEYVLPNDLESQVQVGDYFDLGQLVRAVTTPQTAYALTLSTNGWNLWKATAGSRVTEVELSQEHAADAADATNRMAVRGRKHLRRLVGDEGKKVLQERYAQVVADALRSELGRLDRNAATAVFVFANEPLLSMIQNQDLPWQLIAVPGAPDELRPDQIDEAIRERIGEVTAAAVSRRADQIGHGFADGLAVTDLAQLGRAAKIGAVDTLIYDFTTGIVGQIDDTTGELAFDPTGYDLLSRIAVTVLRNGGEAYAVRPSEVNAQIWNGQLLASLRHPLV